MFILGALLAASQVCSSRIIGGNDFPEIQHEQFKNDDDPDVWLTQPHDELV
jgi:hypothetical protein